MIFVFIETNNAPLYPNSHLWFDGDGWYIFDAIEGWVGPWASEAEAIEAITIAAN